MVGKGFGIPPDSKAEFGPTQPARTAESQTAQVPKNSARIPRRGSLGLVDSAICYCQSPKFSLQKSFLRQHEK